MILYVIILAWGQIGNAFYLSFIQTAWFLMPVIPLLMNQKLAASKTG